MPTHIDKVMEAASFLNRHMTAVPRFGLLTGTGLGDVADGFEDAEDYVEMSIDGGVGEIVVIQEN